MAERPRGCGRLFYLLGDSFRHLEHTDDEMLLTQTPKVLDPRTEVPNLDRSLVDLKATVLEPIVQAYIGEVKSEEREE